MYSGFSTCVLGMDPDRTGLTHVSVHDYCKQQVKVSCSTGHPGLQQQVDLIFDIAVKLLLLYSDWFSFGMTFEKYY